jgi:hypothetical protein
VLPTAEIPCRISIEQTQLLQCMHVPQKYVEATLDLSFETDRRATMLFNNECRIVNDPQSAERRLWQGML